MGRWERKFLVVVYRYDIQHVNHSLPLLPAAPSLAKEGHFLLNFSLSRPVGTIHSELPKGPGVVNRKINR
jgi:hypothetical protein